MNDSIVTSFNFRASMPDTVCHRHATLRSGYTLRRPADRPIPRRVVRNEDALLELRAGPHQRDKVWRIHRSPPGLVGGA